MNDGKIIYLNNEVEILNGKVIINQLESETDSISISGDSLTDVTGANVFETYA